MQRLIGWERTDTDATKYSDTIWGRCPLQALRNRDINGALIEDNFTSFQTTVPTTEGNWAAGNGYSVFSSTGGMITPAASVGGGIVIGSDDDNEGVGIRTLATPFKLIQGAGDFWFEAILSVTTIANTTFELFCGLLENVALTAIIPITTTAATLADKNLVGFYRTESAGSTLDTTYKADGVTAVTVGSAEATIAASTFFKVGMRFVRRGDKGGANTLSFYKDGARLASHKVLPSAAGTDFPNDIQLGLVLATRNAAGSSPGTATLRAWRAAQVYTPFT